MATSRTSRHGASENGSLAVEFTALTNTKRDLVFRPTGAEAGLEDFGFDRPVQLVCLLAGLEERRQQFFGELVVPQPDELLRVFRHLSAAREDGEDLRRDRDDLSGALELLYLVGQVQASSRTFPYISRVVGVLALPVVS